MPDERGGNVADLRQLWSGGARCELLRERCGTYHVKTRAMCLIGYAFRPFSERYLLRPIPLKADSNSGSSKLLLASGQRVEKLIASTCEGSSY